MSLVARQRWDGRIILFCKGADTVMLARARDGQAIQASIEAHLVRRRAPAGPPTRPHTRTHANVQAGLRACGRRPCRPRAAAHRMPHRPTAWTRHTTPTTG